MPLPGVPRRRPRSRRGCSVEAVRFERKGGKDRVVVAMSASPRTRLRPRAASSVSSCTAPSSRAHARAQQLDLTSMQGPDSHVSHVCRRGERRSIVEIDRAGDGQGTHRRGNVLVWSFDRRRGRPHRVGQNGPSAQPRRPSSTTRRSRRVRRSNRLPTTATSRPSAAASGGFHIQLHGQEGPATAAATSSLDSKDIDIHNILRLLADVGHVNIVTADDVAGNVTIRMNNVPWDQALDVVLSAKGLGMVRQGT